MPTAELLVATPANTKVLNLWNGTSNDTPPTDWWAEGFDDSAWETPVAVTPDPGDTGSGSYAVYGLVPMWSSVNSASTKAIILTRTHFTAPATVTDGFGVPLASTDIFNVSMEVSSGAYEASGEIGDGSSTILPAGSGLVYYNGTSGSPFTQSPSGPCVFQRSVSNLHLGADNVIATAQYLGFVNCGTATPYGPWNPNTRTAYATWFALGVRLFSEACVSYGYSTESITDSQVKVLRFSGSPPAGWQTVAFDDSAWANAVVASQGAADFFPWNGWTNQGIPGDPSGFHVNGQDTFYEWIAVAPGFRPAPTDQYYKQPAALWAIANETTASESVIMRIHWTAPTVDSVIRRKQITATGTTIYDGTLVARDWAGFTSVTSYVNDLGGGIGIELDNFHQLITPGADHIIALLMTTDSTQLARGYGAWIQLGIQLANCGPYTSSTVGVGARSFAHIIG